MIVKIKEYSFKTGEGIAIDPNGNEIKFSYKDFKNEKAIPPGHTAEIKETVLTPVPKYKTIIFHINRLIKKIKR